MRARFLGCNKAQIQWGGNDDPAGLLVEGEVYRVIKVEEHSWHTKYYIEGVKGKFNSVCFEVES